MALVEEIEYRDMPMLLLKQKEEDRFPFQFGVRKAQMILKHLEEIKAFVEKHTGEKVK